MKPLYRHLLRIALAGTTIAFAAAPYAHEGMSPLDVLPTLVNPAPWLEASLPLGIVTIVCTLFSFFLSRKNRFFASDRWLIVQVAATGAAITISSYDLCQNIGLDWLPVFAGCHCWLTGAAALCAAMLSTVLLFMAGLFSVKFMQTIYREYSQYLRRRLYRLFHGHIRHTRSQQIPIVRVRLIAFRGPPG